MYTSRREAGRLMHRQQRSVTRIFDWGGGGGEGVYLFGGIFGWRGGTCMGGYSDGGGGGILGWGWGVYSDWQYCNEEQTLLFCFFFSLVVVAVLVFHFTWPQLSYDFSTWMVRNTVFKYSVLLCMQIVVQKHATFSPIHNPYDSHIVGMQATLCV